MSAIFGYFGFIIAFTVVAIALYYGFRAIKFI